MYVRFILGLSKDKVIGIKKLKKNGARGLRKEVHNLWIYEIWEFKDLKNAAADISKNKKQS